MPHAIPLRLPITHITAALIFLVGPGLLMSIGAFIIEKFVFWKMKQGTENKILIYLEQFFDGQRHYFKNLPERLQDQNECYVSESVFPYLE